jgi:hypothetical protein
MKNEQNSLGFSKFRELMDLWDGIVLKETVENEIDKFLTHKEIVMFFIYPIKKDGRDKTNAKKLYGATEDGRLTFAQMKNPNPGDPVKQNDSFQAFDLETLLAHSDEPDDIQRIKIFDKKDLKKIKVVSQDFAVRRLAKLRLAKKIKPINDPEDKKVTIDDE